MEFSAKEIAEFLGGEVKGNDSVKISKVGTLEEADEGCISFLSNPKYENYIYSTQASAVITKRDFKAKKDLSTTLILVDDPYSGFTTLLTQINGQPGQNKVGIEDPSFRGRNISYGEGFYQGAMTYLGNDIKIGDRVKIFPHVYVGDNVTIGDDCTIYPGVRIYPDTIIGNRCTVHAGAVIGSDGFGFAPQDDGSYMAIPQMGNVILEDDVSIGANTVVDCATINSTIVRHGVKLDNLIQIGHNVEVGANTVIAAQAGVSGSSKIGENCAIGGQAGISGHITIANKVRLAAKSGVMNSIKEEGGDYIGAPVMEKLQFFRIFTLLRKLPGMRAKLDELLKKP